MMNRTVRAKFARWKRNIAMDRKLYIDLDGEGRGRGRGREDVMKDEIELYRP